MGGDPSKVTSGAARDELVPAGPSRRRVLSQSDRPALRSPNRPLASPSRAISPPFGSYPVSPIAPPVANEYGEGMSAPGPEPHDLLERLQAGDEDAFAWLVHRYSGKVYAIGLSMLRNEQDARDVLQETFLNAYRSVGGFRGEASLGGWIGRIATNNSLMKLRTRRRKPETSLDIQSGDDGDARRDREIVDAAPWADKLTENRELGHRIREAVEALPESYRVVLILADYREMTMREISDALDLSVPNVKTRLHRARLTVRERLGAYLAGED
jgi:RNA polymerase sigma-70 factor, ECF subfamily